MNERTTLTLSLDQLQRLIDAMRSVQEPFPIHSEDQELIWEEGNELDELHHKILLRRLESAASKLESRANAG